MNLHFEPVVKNSDVFVFTKAGWRQIKGHNLTTKMFQKYILQ